MIYRLVNFYEINVFYDAHRDFFFRSEFDATENRLFKYEKNIQCKIRAIV